MHVYILFVDDTPDNVHGLEEHFQAAQKEKKDMFLLTFKVHFSCMCTY